MLPSSLYVGGMLSLRSKVTVSLSGGFVVGVPICAAVNVCWVGGFPPESAVAVLSDGQVIVGGVASTTVMVKEQLPPPTSEVTLTTVVPNPKKLPEAGVAVIMPQLPKIPPVAVKLTNAPGLVPCVVLAMTEKFSWQINVQVSAPGVAGTVAVAVEVLSSGCSSHDPPGQGASLLLIVTTLVIKVPSGLPEGVS